MDKELIRRLVEKVEKTLPVIQDAVKFCHENGLDGHFTNISTEVTLFYHFEKDASKAKEEFAKWEEEKKKQDSFLNSPLNTMDVPYNYEADLIFSEFSAGLNLLCDSLGLKNPLTQGPLLFGKHSDALLRCKVVIETAKSLALD